MKTPEFREKKEALVRGIQGKYEARCSGAGMARLLWLGIAEWREIHRAVRALEEEFAPEGAAYLS